MNPNSPIQKLQERVRARLMAEFQPGGFWLGELSSSPLATAVAAFALAQVDREAHRRQIDSGLSWLAGHINEDGGWGDCDGSPSNLSTTLLAWSALSLGAPSGPAAARAEVWLAAKVGSLEPHAIARAVLARYGNDRTFSAPILTMCALAGRLGPQPWESVPQLPFEVAVLPHRFFSWLRLPVVSYGLPALIAIGLVRHHHRPAAGAWIRSRSRRRVLDVLARIQPENGGFLEAAPLTSFVVMSLAASGHGSHSVTSRGVKFLLNGMRRDGGWPIDTNLATWVTTLAVNAGAADWLDGAQRAAVREWLLRQQFKVEHPFTHSQPGGWAWTDLPGGVPDADDTAGALLALRRLGLADERARNAARAGIRWLLDLQNRDGGIPTFCRGWGTLPFDRSCPDLTAHAVRAFGEWREDVDPACRGHIRTAVARALSYLARAQRADGSWVPLWFGNQWAAGQENPVYGTAQVVGALGGIDGAQSMIGRGVQWLESAQNEDGGWGGSRGIASSVEETAVAVGALAGAGHPQAVARGVEWLCEHVDRSPAPIGLYFASLWYFEKLYPLVFTAAALSAHAPKPDLDARA
jgi:squalene-hopene/tetraprenyl-beta-curcumene cyclase